MTQFKQQGSNRIAVVGSCVGGGTHEFKEVSRSSNSATYSYPEMRAIGLGDNIREEATGQTVTGKCYWEDVKYRCVKPECGIIRTRRENDFYEESSTSPT